MRDQRKYIRTQMSTPDEEWTEETFLCMTVLEIKQCSENLGCNSVFWEHWDTIFQYAACINTPSTFCYHDSFKHTHDVTLVTMQDLVSLVSEDETYRTKIKFN